MNPKYAAAARAIGVVEHSILVVGGIYIAYCLLKKKD